MNQRKSRSHGPLTAPQRPTSQAVDDFRRRIHVGMTPRSEASWQTCELIFHALWRASGIVTLAQHLEVSEPLHIGLDDLLSEVREAMETVRELIGEALLLLLDLEVTPEDQEQEGQP